MVMRALSRKLLRDVWHTRGQGIAIAMVMAAGIAMFVGYFSTFDSLERARQTYYDRFHFADVFVSVKRAPLRVVDDLAAIAGVSAVTTRIVMDVALDVPGQVEPATGRLISLPVHAGPALNEPFLRRGRYPAGDDEVLASEGFALAHRLQPGAYVVAVVNGHRRALQIVGIALSPEFIYSIRPGEMMPDEARFGQFWMERRALSSAFDMEGAFNDASFALTPLAIHANVIAAIDAVLDRYGSLGAVPRTQQLSHWFVENELNQLQTMGFFIPAIFLSVSAFLLNVVLTRLIGVQREQIAALKALGYTSGELGLHYVLWAVAIGVAGSAAGAIGGAWLGRGMTGIYNDFFRFPTLRYVLESRVVVQSAVIGLGTAALGAFGAVARAVRLPPAEAMRPEPPARHRLTWIDRLIPRRYALPTVKMIVRNLYRQPARAGLSVLGVAFAVALLVLGMFSLDAIELMLDVQFNVSQRQDYTLGFVEPRPARTIHDLAHLPGVLAVEPMRLVPARIRAGHRVRQEAITGLTSTPRLRRVIDASLTPVVLPPDGLVLSTTLAGILRVRPGDRVQLELLEGTRPVLNVAIADLVDEFLGTSVYMDIDALHRLLKESPQISGAMLLTDKGDAAEFYRRVKRTPAIAGVSSKRAAIGNFRRTLAHNMNVMIAFNVFFSSVIAFGVVYNAARISLSERSRELASLRVLGLTRAEISTILLGELAMVLVMAIPLGLMLGYALSALLVSAFNTELFRIPLVVSARTFGFAAATTIGAATFSGLVVRRRLDRLDLVAVLKTRE